jgi:hypothetical protein
VVLAAAGWIALRVLERAPTEAPAELAVLAPGPSSQPGGESPPRAAPAVTPAAAAAAGQAPGSVEDGGASASPRPDRRKLRTLEGLPSRVLSPRQLREQLHGTAPAPAPAADPPAALREVAVHVHPWADIYVDDAVAPAVRGAKQATLSLAPGPHRLRFENTFTAPEEVALEVPASGPVAVPRVQLLRMRPAYLVVEAPAEAEVKVAGKYWGTAATSRVTPIVVPLPEGQSRIELSVEVTLADHQPYVVTTTFTAGETRQIQATLQRAPAPVEPAISP